jgi:acyl-coenzyme A synthetase/AMP-(fatty) acid ligase
MNLLHLPAATGGFSLTHLMVRLATQSSSSAAAQDPLPGFLNAALVAAQARVWQATLLQQPQTHWAIYEPDPQRFAAMLFGAWHARKTVVVVPHTRPAMLRALAQLHCGYLGTFPSHVASLCRPKLSSEFLPELRPLCPDAKISLFTSGSTGEPTRIDKTLQHFAAECDALEAVLGTAMQQQPLVTSTTHQHIYGLLYCVLWPLAAGRPVWMQRLSGAAWQFHPGSRPTVVTTPTALRQLQAAGNQTAAAQSADKFNVAARFAAKINRFAAAPYAKQINEAAAALPAEKIHVDLPAPPTAGLIISSGAPLAPTLAAWAQQTLGCPVVELLGSTETGGIAYRKAGVTPNPWSPLPQVRWRIDHGSLSVCSPFASQAGYFRTADRAIAVPQASAADPQTFELLGRTDRIVKIHEKPVSLAEVEAILSSHPEVARAAALSLQPRLCAAPKLAVVIELTGEKLAPTQDLSAFLRSQVISAAVPEPSHWRYVSQWPAADGIKTTQRDLQNLF